VPVSITCAPLTTNATARPITVAGAWPVSIAIDGYACQSPDGEARDMLRRPLVTYVDSVPNMVVKSWSITWTAILTTLTY